MAGTVFKRVVIFLSFIYIYSCQAVETTKLDALSSCGEQCNKSYAPHTTITNGEPASCQRGCRFYHLSSFVVKEETTPDSMLGWCKKACSEAYSLDTPLLPPCEEGCKFYYVDIKQKQQQRSETKPEDEASLMERLRHATPVMQIRKVMAQVVDGFQVLRTQVLTYFRGEDNKLIAVASNPEIYVDVLPGQEPKQESTNKLLTLLNNFSSERQRDDDNVVMPETETVTRVSLDPRRYNYMMHLLLLLAGVTVAMLGLTYCLAVARTQQRKTLKAANINLALQQEPLKLVRPEDLTKLSLMEEEEAPPLPNKQDLNLSHANV